MVQKGKKQYRVTTGDYENKAEGLNFGYEYTTGNKVNENKDQNQQRNKE